MGATSVTGKGLGESKGKFKQANSGGCCGVCKDEETTVTPAIKRGCHTRYTACGNSTYKANCSLSYKTCC